jgi:Xaa-Pro aminopeptidase
MDGKIIKKRISAVRTRLKKERIDCLIVTKPANVTYTTGFSGDDSWVVITNRTIYLLTDSRYTEQAGDECRGCKIIERKGPMSQAAAKIVKQFNPKTAAVENSTTLAAFEALKKNIRRGLKTAANTIESVRRCKDEGEIATIRKAGKIAAKALASAMKEVKAGITENELAGEIDFQIRKLGAVNSFDTIVAFGPNASRPHHRPGKSRLKKNDTILIDFGARYNGYCCDLTRCFVVGRPNSFYKEVHGVVRQAQLAAIKMIKAGVEIKKVDAAARDVIKKHNLPVYGHGTGHGLGLEVHEEPVVSDSSKGKLQAGAVITIEPGVYIPGKLGIRIEDDILVTETGCKILTQNCPRGKF